MNTLSTTTRLFKTELITGGLARAMKKVVDVATMGLPASFLFLSVLLESGYAGYNRITDTVSELVWGPNGWLETCLFVLAGIILPLLGWRLSLVLANPNARRIAWAVITLMGMAFIAIAIFPTTAPDSTPDTVSAIHERAAQFIAFLFPCACALTAAGLKNDRRLNNLYACSLIAAGLGLTLNAAGLMAIAWDTEWLGAIERAVMMNGFIWLAVAGFSLWQVDCGHYNKPHCAHLWLHPAHIACAIRVRHDR